MESALCLALWLGCGAAKQPLQPLQPSQSHLTPHAAGSLAHQSPQRPASGFCASARCWSLSELVASSNDASAAPLHEGRAISSLQLPLHLEQLSYPSWQKPNPSTPQPQHACAVQEDEQHPLLAPFACEGAFSCEAAASAAAPDVILATTSSSCCCCLLLTSSGAGDAAGAFASASSAGAPVHLHCCAGHSPGALHTASHHASV